MHGTGFRLPGFNDKRLLPPFVGSAIAPHPRSPYAVTTLDFVQRFSFSTERIAILQGLLAYRQSLHEHGFMQGFQWLAGSFVEDIRRIEGREPKDVDSLRSLIEQVNYWTGLFSHRRTTEWKGIAQVELGTLSEDEAAIAYLQEGKLGG